MPSHAIHLGSAWEPPSAAVQAWVRHFGRPSGVAIGDRLVLRCEGPASAGPWRDATLNDRTLEWRAVAAGVLESDVTARISDRNRLLLPSVDEAIAGEHGSRGRVALPAAWGRLSLVVVSD